MVGVLERLHKTQLPVKPAPKWITALRWPVATQPNPTRPGAHPYLVCVASVDGSLKGVILHNVVCGAVRPYVVLGHLASM